MFPPSVLRQLDLSRFSGLSVSLSGGLVTLEIPPADLEYAALEIARHLAECRGVEILSVTITFHPESLTALRFEALVHARKILFTAHLRISGRLLVNDLLQAVATDLRVSGDGIMGDLAALAVQPELEKIADRPLALALPASLPFRLGEVRLEAGPPLRIVGALF